MSGSESDQDRDRFAGRGDDFYALLMGAHEGLSHEESVRLNARLVLLLANQVGDIDTLENMLEIARRGIAEAGENRE